MRQLLLNNLYVITTGRRRRGWLRIQNSFLLYYDILSTSHRSKDYQEEDFSIVFLTLVIFSSDMYCCCCCYCCVYSLFFYMNDCGCQDFESLMLSSWRHITTIIRCCGQNKQNCTIHAKERKVEGENENNRGRQSGEEFSFHTLIVNL